MSSKRSYLESLNAGRQRRTSSTIEEIGRTLDAIGARLDRTKDEPRPQLRATDRNASWPAGHHPPYQDDLLSRGRSPHYRAGLETSMQDLARTMESSRRQEEGIASISRIASELEGVREELRQQLSGGLRREFEALRADIERTYANAATGPQGVDLTGELERLSDAIGALARRSDDRGIGMLRAELDQVRETMDRLAREESVHAVERRWDEFDRRFDAFEERVSASGEMRGSDPAIEALTARLEQISEAVNNLPESLSLRTMEDKVRTLAGAVEQFARQQHGAGPDSFALIEERLDEISRAIVASSVAVQSQAPQVEQFERIEARIASLARQIDELNDDRPSGEIIDRINMLSLRVDEMARRAVMPDAALDQLARQVASIAEKVDSGFAPQEAERVVRGLEGRFTALSDMLQTQSEATTRGQTIFRELESRLEELAARFDQPQGDAIMEAIDARFEELSRRFDQSVASQDRSAISGLEARLEDISTRLEQSSREVASIDPDLIRSLENQVAGLSDHLRKPQAALPEFEDIGPRLEQIEKSIAGSREAILESARAVAENTIRQIAGNMDTPAVAALSQDLRALDNLARRSDERNARTFEAIHDTLLKIVDRLGTLESGKVAPTPAFQSLAETPPLEPADSLDAMGPPTAPPARTWTPAEAAAAAASAAIDDEIDAEPRTETAAKRSMLSGLARAFAGRKDAAKAAAVSTAGEPPLQPVAPEVDLDEPIDPKAANRPLEPGSGAPDLSMIMKRVRDERGKSLQPSDTEAAKSDFIAAARRAAQAAAAEAETRKKGIAITGVTTSAGLGGIFRNHRKTALMAAGGVVLALAGLQLGKAFLADGEPMAVSDTSTPQVASSGPIGDELETKAGADVAAVPRTVEPSEPIAEAVPAVAEDVKDPEATSSLPPDTAAPVAAEEEVAEAAAPEPIVVPADAGPLPLREAAEAGDPKALFEIGGRYAEGRGTKADLAEAAKWYERAADAGFAPAQYRIGNFYEKGTGVARDVAKAKTWYQMAAEQGNASAMHNLAVLFAMGADGTTDNESAGRWFTKAAELGVKDSQFNLGILSAKGVGVPQNLEESYKWFALVAKSGDKDAAQKRDEVANALRPEQLQRARASAELWKPKELDLESNDITIPDAWTESPSKTASIDMKQAVRNIQLILNKNGYDAGGADGVMGAKTTEAITRFQKDNGMQPTGKVTEELVRALLAKK
ncbi:MAG: peptidoglycan-binding protein [Mesorhizobium sp.]|nr:peptidoglycan-binding protein [Mesorhizobium sp.]MCO5160486.1 peptidoglycan-binding protein [Mesorhizobium sp.]